MTHVYIVGNGLFGRVAADLLRSKGIKEVTIIDNEETWAGTRASGNLMKPSWLTGLPGDVVKAGYDTLDELYGLQKVPAEIGLGKTMDLFAVDRRKTYNGLHREGTVMKVSDGEIDVCWQDGSVQKLAGIILVAAGVWTDSLVKSMPTMKRMAGVSFIFRSQPKFKPKLDVWAPYKQSISYQTFDDKVWFGDGSAILEKNWNSEQRVSDALKRAQRHGLPESHLMATNFGLRPYVEGHKNGYYMQYGKRTFVSTGGGKNGIVLAAIQAQRFWEDIRSVVGA